MAFPVCLLGVLLFTGRSLCRLWLAPATAYLSACFFVSGLRYRYRCWVTLWALLLKTWVMKISLICCLLFSTSIRNKKQEMGGVSSARDGAPARRDKLLPCPLVSTVSLFHCFTVSMFAVTEIVSPLLLRAHAHNRTCVLALLGRVWYLAARMAPPTKKRSRSALRLLGKGNNGAAYLRGDGAVVKATSDPSEVAVNMAVLRMQEEGVDTSAFPRIHDIHMGNRVAVIIRENVVPYRQGAFSQSTQTLMARDARWHLGSVNGSGRVRTSLLSQRQLRPLGRSLAFIRHRWGVSPGDIRPGNLGHRRGTADYLLFDAGRSPLETTVAKLRGNDCPALTLRKAQITALTGKAPSVKSCKMVNGQQLRRVMGEWGWSSQEVAETAGFHDPSRRIWLRHGNADSLTHELWHAVGIIDKDMAVWLCEGLTEAAAQDDDKIHSIKHRNTYPEWVRFVRTKVAPLAGMSVLDLARFCLTDARSAGTRLSQLLQQRTGVPAGTWYRTLGPGVSSPQDFLSLQKKVVRK